MTDATQLELNAEQLRALARRARTHAGTLSSYLDGALTTARDDTLWRGAYPAALTARLAGDARALAEAADLLGDDADAWEHRAAQLDSLAAATREEQRRAERDGDNHADGRR